MQRAIRTQSDELGDEYARTTTIDCSDDTDTARQEFKDEADVNIILAKFGVNSLQRQPTWGQEVNYDLNLQTALEAITDAKAAHSQLPDDLKRRYPTWAALLNALEAREIVLTNEPEAAPPPPEPPPTP